MFVSPYHCLRYHWSCEASWEVVETDPGVHVQPEGQALRGDCVVFFFQTGNNSKQAQTVHPHLRKRALAKTRHMTSCC